jgi:hypothetical protein
MKTLLLLTFLHLRIAILLILIRFLSIPGLRLLLSLLFNLSYNLIPLLLCKLVGSLLFPANVDVV